MLGKGLESRAGKASRKKEGVIIIGRKASEVGSRAKEGEGRALFSVFDQEVSH